jgi:hypothetical protein
MSVFNVLPSGVNAFFPTFWKHPDALFKQGLWLATCLHTNQSRSYLNHLVYTNATLRRVLANYVAVLWVEVGQSWSKVCTVLWRSNIVTVGSNSVLKMDMCLVFFCICFVLCMREASQRVNPCTKRPTEGLQIDFETPKMGNFGLHWSV